ncbi:UDP-N-acetylglucosamine--N-acetylmuramyl-(pentapeptide) pyrophosphoryl-undecaprenol N-acetylglucosamine transferase [Sporomusa rhizae]|uniref:UDP-2,4-diacetamido-2,4, 6-trideoxy-beta-L-altropyranose hydrolase n=1 Tax=Sporomusa rhizae TaxID=357999 RepID=UPI00352A3D3F
MLNIAVRADGGKNVGMGHVMRCLSLANAFRRNGHKVCFFTKLNEGIEAVKSENFDVVRLPSVAHNAEGFFYGDPSELGTEIQRITKLLITHHINILVVDTYNVSNEYFLSLKPYVEKLVYIDDINTATYAVDIIVNGNITGQYLEYQVYNEQQVLLLGPAYNMIRDEFRGLPKRMISRQVFEIMITTGGNDLYNLTERLLVSLLNDTRFNDLRFNVLVGGGFTNKEYLIKLSQRYDNIVLYANSEVNKLPQILYSEVSAIMLRSDLAISAGGSTLYEFAACGTPTIAFILAENQEFIVRKMEQLGYIQSFGWYNEIDDTKISSKLVNLMCDYEKRKEMSQKGQSLVDGKGTERIAQRIIDSFGRIL